MALGWQRFSLLLATRPQLLQMNFGLSTSGMMSFTSRSHEQQVREHILSAPEWWPLDLGLITTLLVIGLSVSVLDSKIVKRHRDIKIHDASLLRLSRFCVDSGRGWILFCEVHHLFRIWTGDCNAEEHDCRALPRGDDYRHRQRGLFILQVSILGAADGQHRHCVGVCGILFEISEAPVVVCAGPWFYLKVRGFFYMGRSFHFRFRQELTLQTTIIYLC